MKLLMKRDISDQNARFVFLDEFGREKYIVTGKMRSSGQNLTVWTTEHEAVAEITHYTVIVNHFSVRYDTRRLSLVPQFDKGFVLLMFGSSLSFSGSASLDKFRLSDVDHSTVMSMQRRFCESGEYHELKINNTIYEKLSIVTAVCTALYIDSRQPRKNEQACPN